MVVDLLALHQRYTQRGKTTDDGSTGKIKLVGATMLRYLDGQITEEWVYYDTAQFANQLGAAEIPHTR